MPNNVNIKTLVDDLGNIVVPITHVNAVFDNEGHTLPLMMDRKYPIDSKTAEEGGTALSLVSTGEKYIWNNKLSSSEKGANNGLATLDSTGKVPSSQLPAMDYVPNSEKGASNGVATLDNSGKVPSSQLPSYVDDIIEGYYHGVEDPDTHEVTYNFYSDSLYTELITPETGKIYVDLATNLTYRWSGSLYIVMSSPYVLPNASANVLGGIKVGTNLSIDGNGVLSATDTTYSAATQSTDGLLSSTDKTKLDGIEAGALAHIAPTSTEVKSALGTGSGTSKYLREDGTWLTPPDNNTTYSNGTGLSLSGTTFSLSTSGVSAGTYGPSANVSGSNGATISVPQITVDAYGRVTSVTNRTYTSVDTDTNTWPTYTSQLTNNSGFITGITKTMVVNALGYTPPTTDTDTWPSYTSLLTNNSGYITASSFTSNNKGTSVGNICVMDGSNGLGYTSPSNLATVLGNNGLVTGFTNGGAEYVTFPGKSGCYLGCIKASNRLFFQIDGSVYNLVGG